MQLIAYCIIYPFLWLISILPFRALYVLSDAVCFLLYRVFGYRKKVVKQNLELVFPEKTKEEIKTIMQRFYSHLCDMFLEMVKTLTISRGSLHQRFNIENPEALHQLEQLNKSVVLLYGHYASYEWSSVLQSHVNFSGLAVYKKIANPYFDRLVKRIRSKFNTELVTTKETVALLKDLNDKKDHRIIAFLIDQSPKLKSNNTWLPFMGINVPCFIGAEITAKTYDYSVAYLKIDKVKRGFYNAEIVTITTEPNTLKPLDITKEFYNILESQIRKKPELYLWTHKRWKHKDHAPEHVH